MPVPKIKIGIVASINKIKVPFHMGFNKIKKFYKHFNVFDCPQGAKATENNDFLNENGLFSVRMFLPSTSSVYCHILLERTVQTDKNGI